MGISYMNLKIIKYLNCVVLPFDLAHY